MTRCWIKALGDRLKSTAAQGVQSVWRHAKQASIVGDTQLLVISLFKESAEAAENLGAAALFLRLAVAG